MWKKIMILVVFCVLQISVGYCVQVDFEDTTYNTEFLAHYRLDKVVSPTVMTSWYTEHSVEEWYTVYLSYCINTNRKLDVTGFSTYAEYVRYWEEFIPYKFLYPLLNESLKQGVPMRLIYAVAYVESMNFKVFESLKPNVNGTVDIGVMGLNERNFDETTPEGVLFLKNFFYFDGEYEGIPFDKHNQLHVIKTCVRFLKSNLSLTSGSFRNAAICYNGGYGRWLNGKPVKAAVKYGDNIVIIAAKHKNFKPITSHKVNAGFLEMLHRFRVAEQKLKFIATSEDVRVRLYRAQAETKLKQMERTPLRSLPTIYAFSPYMQDLFYDRSKFLVREICIDSGIYLGLLSEDGQYVILS